MGLLLLVPFFLIRFGLLSFLSQEAVKRASHFAPLQHQEKWTYWLYQFSTLGMIVYLCLHSINHSPTWLLVTGIIVYLAGLILLTLSVVSFAVPLVSGMNRRGLYRISRHPMYVAYFIYFLGCVLLTQSVILFVMLLLFQLSAHWIILSEERWCIEQFGDAYRQYQKQVRRYF